MSLVPFPLASADEGHRHRYDLRDAIDEVVEKEAADEEQELHALLRRLQQLQFVLEPRDMLQPKLVVLAEQGAEFISPRTHIKSA